jgi:methyl-accepting chemotaxis protein
MKQKKRFSLRNKMMVVFGLLIFVLGIIRGAITLSDVRGAMVKKVDAHLIDKAGDVAEIIDGRVTAFWQYLEGIQRLPAFQDSSISYAEKARILKREADLNKGLDLLVFVNTKGIAQLDDGRILDLKEREWFKKALSGQRHMTEPYISKYDNSLSSTVSIPVYNDTHDIIGVLACDVPAMWLSNQVKDIVVGNSGSCYILGLTGTNIADKDADIVKSRANFIELSKQDTSLVSIATFEQKAMESTEAAVGFYDYNGEHKIASFAKVETTGWTVVINAPVDEFMGAVDKLKYRMWITAFIFIVIVVLLIYFFAGTIVKPVKLVVNALKEIAHGDGDLTVRLPLVGNDEITDLARYFNETIEKIGKSIKQVGISSTSMEHIGNELATNMTETASAVHQISANIEGLKKQALTQAASVTETATTIEEIVRTIKQLHNSIQGQAASVAESSASIEQMVASLVEVNKTLVKTDEVIGTLTAATGEGRAAVGSAYTVTKKIAEESGSLLEASSVIQNIAGQTNLLAMNAAIEAAHAGAAGKGFAVVADEIRKLAEDSATQGKTITTTLKRLGGEIASLSASSKKVEEKFNAIFDLAERVKEMSSRLTEAAHEHESGSKEVLDAIREINMVTNQVNDGSAEMLRGSEQVAGEMQKLDQLTRIITDSMNEMASGAVQISNAVQEVNDISQKNKDNIQNLAAEVGKFKA